MKLIISDPSVGILIPIPQYPLYTASLALNEARPVPYYLDESSDWSLDVDGLEAIVSKARSEGTDGRCTQQHCLSAAF
jgi:alanine transaminase